MLKFNRFDPETTRTTDLVIEAFNGLTLTLTRTFSNKAAEYEDGGLSPKEIERRNAVLLEIRTSLLPCAHRQLTDLLVSLDITDLTRDPNPKLLATLDIIKKLGLTLGQLKSSTNSVTLSPPPASSRFEDCNHGLLKIYRSNRLQSKIIELTETHLCSFFNQSILFLRARKSANNPGLNDDPPPEKIDSIDQRKLLISFAALSSKSINDLIQWLQLKGDFEILQVDLQPHIDQLNSNLAELKHRISLPLPHQPKRRNPHNLYDSDDDDYSDHRPSTQPQPNQAENQAGQGGVGGDNDNEDGSELDSSGSGTSHSSGQSDGIPVRWATVKLAKKSIPMTKLIRIFFNKLSSRGSNKAPFKLDPRISSAEFECLLDRLNEVIETLNKYLKLILSIYDNDDLGPEEFNLLGSESCSLSNIFDTSLLHLAFHLVPVDQTLIEQDPYAPNLFNTWFFELRKQFNCAATGIRWSLYSFRQNILE